MLKKTIALMTALEKHADDLPKPVAAAFAAYNKAAGGAVKLTPAQFDVLEQVANGAQKREVASERGTSLPTTRAILRDARGVLGAKNNEQAISLIGRVRMK